MMPIADLESSLNKDELTLIRELTTPAKVQSFLDATPYSPDPFYRSPLRVVRDRKAHCFDGAVFAAAILRRIGYPPLILELIPNHRDDDHLLAVFKLDGTWGAVAQSNFTGLRYREPIYRTLRELVMSYFDPFYNVEREKTLRGYGFPMNLARYDPLCWEVRDEPLDRISDDLDDQRHFSLLTPKQEGQLSLLDERSAKAGLSESVDAGLWKPGKQ
jgi:hypothetical protein